MPVKKGTTLIVLATDDGLLIAADDIMYREQEGQAIPVKQNVRKVWAMGNIMIGSSGILFCPEIEYEFENWIANFIEAHRGATDKLPSDIAEAIHVKMRETFQPVETLVKKGKWEAHAPGERLVNYVIAGYTKNFRKPYIFEVGAEVNSAGDGLRYIAPLHHVHQLPHRVWFGEDQFFLRAEERKEPEASLLGSIASDALNAVAVQLPDIPEPLQETVAIVVGSVKVEAHFNPNKVGDAVNLIVIDRASRKHYLAIF